MVFPDVGAVDCERDHAMVAVMREVEVGKLRDLPGAEDDDIAHGSSLPGAIDDHARS
jgi:hypothetical protein